ncbi:MAG: hypothetical protein RLZZ15_186, partial [Verrucomicrobiota bacterium]
MKRLRPLLALALLALVAARAADTESLAERSLRQIAERQRELFASAVKAGDNLDESSFRNQAQTLG